MNFYNRTEILLTYLSREIETDGLDAFRTLISRVLSISSVQNPVQYKPYILGNKYEQSTLLTRLFLLNL